MVGVLVPGLVPSAGFIIAGRRGACSTGWVRCLLAAIRCPKIAAYRNLGVHLRVLSQAQSAGCDLALFPEMSLTGSVNPGAHPERLISLDHPAVGRLAAAT